MHNSTTTRSTTQPTLFLLHPTVAQDGRNATQRFRDGFDAFCAGASIMDLYDPDEQRGWWSALDRESEAETAGYADTHGF